MCKYHQCVCATDFVFCNNLKSLWLFVKGTRELQTSESADRTTSSLHHCFTALNPSSCICQCCIGFLFWFVLLWFFFFVFFFHIHTGAGNVSKAFLHCGSKATPTCIRTKRGSTPHLHLCTDDLVAAIQYKSKQSLIHSLH